MTYGQAYLSGWKETFNFSGRASLTTGSSVLLSYPLRRCGCC